ncbi:MAG: YtxH domain-containing protein [Agriterribacter sp.]
MSVSNKHIATFLLGAAAALGAYKYSKMSDEEKEKLADNIKDKFHKLKDEAESGAETAKNYFNDLKDKAGSAFKEHFPDIEKHFENFFKPGTTDDNTAKAGSGQSATA